MAFPPQTQQGDFKKWLKYCTSWIHKSPNLSFWFVGVVRHVMVSHTVQLSLITTSLKLMIGGS